MKKAELKPTAKTAKPSPWRNYPNNERKLKAAKKVAKSRYDRERRKDELTVTLNRESTLRTTRRKRGQPEDAPKMKPWDFVKGKVRA